MGDEESGSDWDSISESQPQNNSRNVLLNDVSLAPQQSANNNNKEKPSIGIDKSFDFSSEVPEKKQPPIQHPIPGRDRPKHIDSYLPKKQNFEGRQVVDSENSDPTIGKKMVKNRSNVKNLTSLIGSPTSNATSRQGDSESVITAVMKNQINQDYNEKQQHRGSDGSLMGLDNPAFMDNSFSFEEKVTGSLNDKSLNVKSNKIPVADELINLIHFDPPIERYFPIREDLNGSCVDPFKVKLVRGIDKAMREIVAVAKIPFVISIIILGHIFGLFLSGLLQPLSDRILKPLLTTLHNAISVPFCGLFYNCCHLTAHGLDPCCKVVRARRRATIDEESNSLSRHQS